MEVLIKAWDEYKILSCKLKKEEHTVNLHSRKTVVTAENYAMGFDGKEVWNTETGPKVFKKVKMISYDNLEDQVPNGYWIEIKNDV